MELGRLFGAQGLRRLRRQAGPARAAATPPAAGAEGRSPFQIDQDRIVYSRPFRRLQHKTQVHPLPANDHVRNRLVHTLEVASAGRDLGVAVGRAWERAGKLEPLDLGGGRPVTPAEIGYLVQAACLAHDIGNPTFGHAGEEAISSWLAENLRPMLAQHMGEVRLTAAEIADLCAFEGNAQGFRILAHTDVYRGNGGLRLTAATLSAFLKYPWRADQAEAAGKSKKFGFYRTEQDLAEQVLDACGHHRDAATGIAARNPLVWLMEAADDLCYTIADYEDAHEMGIVSTREFVEAMAAFAADAPDWQARHPTGLQRVGYLRGRAIGALLEAATRTFLDHEHELFAGKWPGQRERPGARLGLLDLVASAPGNEIGAAFAAIRRFNAVHVYRHPRKAEIEVAAHAVLGGLLAVFLPAFLAFHRAGGEAGGLELRHRQALALVGEYAPAPGDGLAETVRCAIDYVAGMTDRYAATLHRRLRGDAS